MDRSFFVWGCHQVYFLSTFPVCPTAYAGATVNTCEIKLPSPTCQKSVSVEFFCGIMGLFHGQLLFHSFGWISWIFWKATLSMKNLYLSGSLFSFAESEGTRAAVNGAASHFKSICLISFTEDSLPCSYYGLDFRVAFLSFILFRCVRIGDGFSRILSYWSQLP